MPTALAQVVLNRRMWLALAIQALVLSGSTTRAQDTGDDRPFVLLHPAFAPAPLDELDLERVHAAALERARAEWPKLRFVSPDAAAALGAARQHQAASSTVAAMEPPLHAARDAARPLELDVACWDHSAALLALLRLMGKGVTPRGCAVAIRGGPTPLGAVVTDPLAPESWVAAARRLVPASTGPGVDSFVASGGAPTRRMRKFSAAIDAWVGPWAAADRQQDQTLLSPLEEALADCEREGAFVLWVSPAGSVTKHRSQPDGTGKASCLDEALSRLRFSPGAARALIGRVQIYALEPVARPATFDLPAAKDYLFPDGEEAHVRESVDHLFRVARRSLEGCGGAGDHAVVRFAIAPIGAVEDLVVDGGAQGLGACVASALKKIRASPRPARKVAVEVPLRWQESSPSVRQ